MRDLPIDRGMNGLSYEAFIGRFRREFGLLEQPLDRNDLLIDDLGFDSFELFRLALFLEMHVPGFELDEDVDLHTVTVQNVFETIGAPSGDHLHE